MTGVGRTGLSCVVQAGGLSSRMGTDKARLAFRGRPLVERVLDNVAPAASELIVTTSRPDELSYLEGRTFGGLSVHVAPDLPGGPGAMRGIASSLEVAHEPLVAILACDMPFASADLVCALARRMDIDGVDACVPRTSEGIEPLCAVWRRNACLPVARELLNQDIQRIRCLIRRVSAGYLEEPQIIAAAGSLLCFENVNTPEEFAAAEALEL